jgi:phosphoribosylformylglycinamidine cyclo-ligase
MERTFNLGVGMVAVLPPERGADGLNLAQARGITAWRIGHVEPGSGYVRVTGEYRPRRS